MNAKGICLGICFLCVTLDPAMCESPNQVRIEKDIVYGEVEGRKLKLDLALPTDTSRPAPAILVIHGGGWRMGDKSNHTDEIRTLASKGYVAAAIGYRLVPEAIFPAQVDDVRCAARFLRAKSDDYQIDPDRIGAMGFSAGAHLAMMLGVVDPGDGFETVGGWETQDSDVDAVVAYFGPTDLINAELPGPGREILKGLFGATREESPEAYRLASPVTHVDPRDAPMLLFQGTRDPLVPFDQAVRMANQLTKSNVEGRVELLLGANHGWRGDLLSETRERTLEFFDQRLK